MDGSAALILIGEPKWPN